MGVGLLYPLASHTPGAVGSRYPRAMKASEHNAGNATGCGWRTSRPIMALGMAEVVKNGYLMMD